MIRGLSASCFAEPELVTAVLQRDYPVALWLSLLLTGSVILINFVANIGYALADPRIRVSSDGGGG